MLRYASPSQHHLRFRRHSRNSTGSNAATASGSESSLDRCGAVALYPAAVGDGARNLRDRRLRLRLGVRGRTEEQRRPGELDAGSPHRPVGLRPPRWGEYALARTPEPDQHELDPGPSQSGRHGLEREPAGLSVGQDNGDTHMLSRREEVRQGKFAE